MIRWIEKIPCVSWREGLVRLFILALIVYALVFAVQIILRLF